MAVALDCTSSISLDSDSKLQCKKCREVLINKSEHNFRDVKDSVGYEDGNMYALDDENKPQWVEQQIEEGGWTKGKLSCFKCISRVGGFDFVSGQETTIYITKSKVDVKNSSGPVGVNIIEPTKINPSTSINTSVNEPSGSQVQEIGSNSADGVTITPPSDQSLNQTSESGTSSSTEGCNSSERTTDNSHSNQDDETDIEIDEEVSSSSMNHTDHELMGGNCTLTNIIYGESSSEEDVLSLQQLTRRQLEKIKRRKKRGERQKKKKAKKMTQESKVEEKMRELMEAEPELEALPDDLICPVCLDLLYEPFQTEPCHHIFCEPCLRRLGQKNAMATKCPLCRSRIRFCKHLAATSREIREQHEAMYLRRKKFERSTPVFSYPLPWTPGWRNLLRGRPLGGNTIFVDENNQAEYMRTVLLQIPYYIPPVFLANIFNILVFGFLLGVVELLPTFLYALMGLRGSTSGSGGSINLTDVLPDSTDDTSSPGDDIVMDNNNAITQNPDVQPDPDVIPDLLDSLPESMSVEAEALDSTFYFILFVLSLLAAVAGQLIINHGQGRNRFGHRLTDTMVVICLTCFPLLIIPTFIPYRAPHGNYLGSMLKRIIGYAIDNISIHTAVLVLLVSFIYHFDVIDEIMA